jgi:sterol 3beta-glucosyltransferase
MKITIISPGSRGDVQPYVALGKGLLKAGHSVRLLTSADFRSMVTNEGLEFWDLGGSIQSVAIDMGKLLEQGNFLKILSRMGAAAKSMAAQGLRSGLEACQGTNLIIGGVAGFFTGYALAEKLNRPFLPAFYYPLTPTSEFPNALAPLPPVRLPSPVNRLTHRLAQQMLWVNFRSADNQARREVLGLPPIASGSPFAAWEKRNGTVLYGYSTQVIPRPADWPDCIHVTGYWFLEPDPVWQPPVELTRFLEAGSPPVYIGFGSMGSSKGEATTTLILKALEMNGQRGVLLSSNLRGRLDRLPSNVFVIDSIPFDWLFPRMAAVVHHGGAGTTSMALRAGVPAVVVPFMGDQPFWARRVHELGAGPSSIPRRRLTAERLAEGIHIAVSDRSMAEAAARLGGHIRSENGVAEAVSIIEQSVG